MISALITLYNPTTENKNNVLSISRQVDRVFACDNSSNDNSELFKDVPSSVIYLPYQKNLGISMAFNTVLKNEKYWKDQNKDSWVLFFDQDSKIEDGHIEKLIKEFQHIKESGTDVGCLGPVYYDASSGRIEVPKAKQQVTEDSYVVSSIITSSMLTTYNVLYQIGFWNEDIFLDMADWDLCWRIQRCGKKSCLTNVITLHHTLGLGRKKVGPISLKVTNPIREYYQIRDCLYLKNEKYVPLKYKVRFILMVFLRSWLHVKYLDHGDQRKKYIKQAKADYKKRIRGEYIPD